MLIERFLEDKPMKKQHKLSLLAVLVISNTTYAEEQLEAINVTAEQQVK